MTTAEILSINPEQFHGLLNKYDEQFRPDEYGQPRANRDKLAPRMGDWLEEVLGVFPGVELPKDRSILRKGEYGDYDGVSPMVKFVLRTGKSKDVDYIKGHIRVPYADRPESGVSLVLERSCRDERITGEFKFTKDGVMTEGSLMSHLQEGPNNTYSLIIFDGKGVVNNVQHRMSQAVSLGDHIAIPKLLHSLTTGERFGKIVSDVQMVRLAKI